MSYRAHLTSILSFSFIALNLIFWSLPLTLLALLKLALPGARIWMDPAMSGIYRIAVHADDAWLTKVIGNAWDAPDLSLDPTGTYIAIANHRSWIDVLLLQSVIARRGPIVKFLSKRELIFVPVLGLIFWAFDFPLLRRKGGASADGSEPGRSDRESILAACRHVREKGGAILSFAEGTRFTPEKHVDLKGRYRHLLPPRAGGFSALYEGLGDRLSGIIDITLIYPQAATFWEFLAGGMTGIRVEATVHPPETPGLSDARDWLARRWEEKDARIEHWQSLDSGVSGQGPGA